MRKNRRKMDRMKRAGAVLLALILLCGLTACGESGKEREWKTEFSSTDWKTLEFSLDGRVCTFPVSCADLEALGYQMDKGTRQELLKPEYYTTGIPMENKAGVKFYVRFKNFDDEKNRKLKDCDVYGLTFHYYSFEDTNPDVMLCNGISFHSTVDEVIAAMGEPYDYTKNEHDGGEYLSSVHETLIYYTTDSVWGNSIKFRFMDGEMVQIDMTNTD